MIAPAPAPAAPAVSPDQLVADVVDHALVLRRLAERRRRLEAELRTSVRQAHLSGLSYARIGELLGMTRQSAWERDQW